MIGCLYRKEGWGHEKQEKGKMDPAFPFGGIGGRFDPRAMGIGAGTLRRHQG